MHTYARWRPLNRVEAKKGGFTRVPTQQPNGFYSVSIAHPTHRPWKGAGFSDVYEPEDNNGVVFDAVVAEAIPKILGGATCTFFAYGHSGSGKTHTMIGYDYETQDKLGLCLAAARRLFDTIEDLNRGVEDDAKLGIGFSLIELRKNVAYDLLNDQCACHIREGADGKTHIRGPTETLEDGKVRVRPVAKRPFWTYAALKKQLQDSLKLRAVGSSSVHDLSSRTHAVLELEVVNKALVDAREALYNRQAELVPVGKRALDIRLEEDIASIVRQPDGTYRPNPDRPKNQKRVDEAEAEKDVFEGRVKAAEQVIAEIMQNTTSSVPLGGRLVFVDLAGSEYQQGSSAISPLLARQTPKEKQEGRQINTDLLALKEVIRASASRQARIPFRSSPLTMVLREHFLGAKDGTSAMIVTLSPALDQYQASLNSLKYGSLVGAVSA